MTLAARIFERAGAIRPYAGNFLFLLGSGRSGNTLLRKIIVENFDVYIPGETYVIPDALEAFNGSLGLPWSRRAQMVLSLFESHPDFSTFSRRSLTPLLSECDALLNRERTFGNILSIIWRFLSEDAGVDYTLPGDKTPYNMTSIRMIARAFPKGSFLFITRHPYDVCASYIKMGRYEKVESAAHRWLMAHRNWRSISTENSRYRTRLVRYEDLVSDHNRVIQEIGTWIQARPRKEEINKNTFWGDLEVLAHHAGVKLPVHVESIGRGLRTLTKEDKELIARVVGDEAQIFGFEL